MGELLIAMRREREMSQADVARASKGVTLSHIGLIETGERSASVDKVNAIADALHATDAERSSLQTARRVTLGGSQVVHVEDVVDELTRPISMSADGADLEELRRLDPEQHAAIASMLRLSIERARERNER